MKIENSKTFTSSSLLGIDCRSGASSSKARYMKNLLPKNGALCKRNGFEDIAIFQNESGAPVQINGIFDYFGSIIVHAGEHLYNCGKNPFTPGKVLTEYQKISKSTLENKPICAALHADKLWLVSNGELLCYDGSDIKPLSSEIYTPITRGKIQSIECGSDYTKGEPRSILTTKRANKLLGNGNIMSSYVLDAPLDTSKGFLMTCKMEVCRTPTQNQVQGVCFTEQERLTRENVSGVAGTSAVEQVYRALEGTSTSYGFDAEPEINIFLKSPIRARKLTLGGQNTAGVPKIKLSYGTSTVYESSGVSGVQTLNLSSEVYGKLIDSVTLYGNDVGARIKSIDLQGNEVYEGEVVLRYNYDSASYNQMYHPTAVSSPNGQALTICTDISGASEKSTGISFKGGFDETRLCVHFEAPCPVPQQENITISFFESGREIPKIRFATECKTNTGEQILALCLERGRVAFTSTEHGFAYVPSDLVLSLGDQSEITAICQMHDFVIGAYKTDKSFYIRLGNGKIEYSSGALDRGCLENRLALSVNRDTLTLDENGVLGTQGYCDSEAVIRSMGISSLLDYRKGQNAFFLSYEDRLYIFFENDCLVADTRYRSRSKNAVDDGFEYEWFLLDNISASCGAVIDGKLYLGTRDGKIRTLGQGFCDISVKNVRQGEYLFAIQQGKSVLYLNDELEAKSGAKIEIQGAKVFLGSIYGQLDCDDVTALYVSYEQLFYSNGTAKLYAGMDIYAKSENELIQGQISEIDHTMGILLTTLPASKMYTGLYVDSAEQIITLKKQDWGFNLCICDDEITLENTDEVNMYLSCSEPVVSEYVSTLLSFDTPQLTKTLYRVALTLLPQSGGEIGLGYETNSSSAMQKVSLGNDFDMSALDFDKLNLGKSLNKECAIRCFERGFTHLVIVITSNEACDFGISGYTVVYKQGTALKRDI